MVMMGMESKYKIGSSLFVESSKLSLAHHLSSKSFMYKLDPQNVALVDYNYI